MRKAILFLILLFLCIVAFAGRINTNKATSEITGFNRPSIRTQKGIVAAVGEDALLLESGDYILLESGDRILLE